MEEFYRRLKRFNLIPSEEGICANCGKEKKLVAESKRDGRKYCSKCFKDYVYLSIARKEILPSLKHSSSLPRKTFIDNAFVHAGKLFGAWLKNNWKKLIASNEFQKKFEECKLRGIEREPEEEPEEIKRIREEWRRSREPQSIFRFFHFYWLGRDISRKNRKKRRERLRKLSEALGKKIRTKPEFCLLYTSPSPRDRG